MTEQIAALDALIEAVEAGDRHGLNRTMAEIGGPSEAWPWDWMSRIDASFTGSLDAAKALHKALVPDRSWDVWRSVGQDGMKFYGCNIPGVDSEFNAEPARAWLIAILKAYRAGL